MYSVPALFGQQSIEDINALIVETVPKSACTTVSNISSNGTPLAGKIALIYGDSHCLLMQKALNAQEAGAAAVLIYSCSPAGMTIIFKQFKSDFCDPSASVMLGLAGYSYSIPSSMISYYDGAQILSWISQNITVSANIFGTGNQTDPYDVTALRTLYATLKQNNGGELLPLNGFGTSFDISGSLSNWEMLLNTTYDPCRNRMYGIYCHQGKVIWLNCYGCGFTGAFPESFGLLTHLQEVDLSIGNTLTSTIPCSLTNITGLKMLLLGSNSLTNINECFGDLNNLVTLDLSSNLLPSIPSSFTKLKSLKTLNLRYNSIATMPILNGLSNLTSIDVSINQIASDFGLWNFASLPNLVKIDFHSNKFNGSIFASQFDGLRFLTYIDISKNQISGNLPTFTNCANLTTVNMGYNQVFIIRFFKLMC